MADTTRRIVYCEPSQLSSLPADKSQSLDPEFPVWAASDDALPMIPGKFSILYFSRLDYDRAMRGLSLEQQREGLTARRERWSPDAASQSIPWLAGELRRCLNLTAMALQERTHPGTTGPLQKNLEHTIKRLVALRDRPPLGLLMPSELFELAVEEETRLSMEYQDLPVPGGRELAEQREHHAATLARIMADLGDDSFVDALPFVDRNRGVNVSPLDGAIRVELIREGEPITDWSGGTVISWPHEDLDRLDSAEEVKVSIHVLYLDGSAYEEFAANTTKPQQERDFGERLTAAKEADTDPAIGDSVTTHVNTLLTDHVAYLWSLRDLFVDLEQSQLADPLDPLIHEDIAALAAALQSPPGRPPTTERRGLDSFDRLLVAERQVQESAELFARLHHAPGWLELRSDFQDFLEVGSMLQELTDARSPT